MNAGEKQREACFAANKIKNENHKKDEAIAKKHNALRKKGIENCKPNRIPVIPALPVSTCN